MAESSVISDYSPNIRWGKQRVEIMLKQWKYEARFVEEVGGNCTGLTVMQCALGQLYDRLEGDPARVILATADGEQVMCVDDDDRGEDWLADMCVSLRVIAWDPPTVNEVRALNGAQPLPDGDRPYQPL